MSDFRLEAKARQTAKLAEIHEALVAAGCDTTVKQAAVLGIGRSTAWVLLNRDKRAGPSAKVIKRILSSPQVPMSVRQKIEQYIEEKVSGLYGHSETATRSFRNQFQRPACTLRRTCERAVTLKVRRGSKNETANRGDTGRSRTSR